MEIDYLIIGQGLAGSLLAWELTRRQKKIIIVDNNNTNASQVAAGLINPVTGMRFVKSSNADQLLPFAIRYYQQLSSHFQQPFYIEKPMLRILRSNKEVDACNNRFSNSNYHKYLDRIVHSYPDINCPYGILKQKQTGYLLTTPLLTALKNHVISLNAYIKDEVHYDDITLLPSLQWKNIRPKRIIFCEGHHATNNPWFSALPFQLVKGEIITATATNDIQQHILNYGYWFIPLDNRQFRTGASFDRDTIDNETSSKTKEILLNTLNKVYSGLEIKHISRHQAGIRPTTLDKKPFIGSHPKYPDLIIFNGFGAKGSLQIPWYCQCLANYLLNNQPIPHASSILRYQSSF